MPGLSDHHGEVAVSATKHRTRKRHVGTLSLKFCLTASSQWWDVSSGCPVLAGAFCSMAVMFNVCALVDGWQQSVPADGTIFEPHTPSWLTGLKATSLALSTAAYMLYLYTMILHTDSVLGFVVTVIAWLTSAIILFSLIGIEVRQHQQFQGHQAFVYTENFYSAIISAGLYILIAGLLSIYMVSVKVASYSPAERRKIECTSIVFRVITFTILLLGGAAVYSTIEGWSLMDALYFTDYTLLTIGLGNIAPQTHLGRSLLFPYALLGITSLGFLITAVVSFTDQMRELKLKCKVDEVRRQIGNEEFSEKRVRNLQTAEGIPSQVVSARNCVLKGKEMLEVRNVKSTFYKRRRWIEVGLFFAAWFVLWFFSAGVFYHSEAEDHWTYFVALYFTYTALTTIGYGDYFPTSNLGKVFFVFWSLLAIPILTNLVTAIGSVFRVWLVFCSGWIWRCLFPRRIPRKHHDHDYVCRILDTSALATTNKFPDTGPRNFDLDLEGRAYDYSGIGQDSLSAQNIDRRRDLGVDKQHRIVSQRASTYYRLLLSEEIGSLILKMGEESLKHQEELCCTWSRIIPLLQADGDTDSLFELTPLFASARPEHMTLGIHDERKASCLEKDAAILWMLKLLVEKLSSDLRKELPEMSE